MDTPVLIIFKKDLKTRNFWDWFTSHISGSLPPHRYIGTLEILPDSLKFSGLDKNTNKDTMFYIEKDSITEVFYGYDNDFNLFQTRGLGLTWAPVRLRLIDRSSQEDTVYLITGYNRIGTTNKQFYIFLTEWLS